MPSPLENDLAELAKRCESAPRLLVVTVDFAGRELVIAGDLIIDADATALRGGVEQAIEAGEMEPFYDAIDSYGSARRDFTLQLGAYGATNWQEASELLANTFVPEALSRLGFELVVRYFVDEPSRDGFVEYQPM